MTAWPLTLDVPAKSIALPVMAPDAPNPASFRPLTVPTERPIAWALLLLAVLFLIKRRFVEVRMGRARLLVQAPWTSALAVTGIALGIGQWLAPNHLVCALPLIAFFLHRPAKWVAPTQRKGWRSASATELPEAKGPARDFLDGTTRAGLVVLVGGGMCLIALGQPTAALLLLPIFLTGTQHHRTPTIAQASKALRLFASDLRLSADAPDMSFGWELSSDGVPRLRAHLPMRRAGLLTLGFVVTASSLGPILRHKVMLLVETRAQSDADDLVRRRTNAEPELRSSDGSIVRLIEWDAEAVELLRVLARKAPKPMKASRGTWLLREIAEPGRRAA
ncbi:MAG: hypothetical protein EP303_00455 [Deltaproteobacteria bacterium]|nr:MAG: hypothetical protein EP303_00455 [Deltaproteobacteria bacterium]